MCNLLSKAIEFTQEGYVCLEIRQNDETLSIIVTDTGNGMNIEQQRVFGAFERLSNAVTQDGFGLGLSIVKHIIDMLNGTIQLESEKGKGSRFSVKIPTSIANVVLEEVAENMMYT